MPWACASGDFVGKRVGAVTGMAAHRDLLARAPEDVQVLHNRPNDSSHKSPNWRSAWHSVMSRHEPLTIPRTETDWRNLTASPQTFLMWTYA
jgi:hypothetical protein